MILASHTGGLPYGGISLDANISPHGTTSRGGLALLHMEVGGDVLLVIPNHKAVMENRTVEGDGSRRQQEAEDGVQHPAGRKRR